MLNTKEIVKKLCMKYGTTSPYELCDMLGIIITRCELGTIRGYFYQSYRIKQIFINCNLTKSEEIFVLSHELGHAMMHPTINTPFLKENTLVSVNKMEIEANKFAIYLLIPDEALEEYEHYTTNQLSRLFGYNEELIKLRLK